MGRIAGASVVIIRLMVFVPPKNKIIMVIFYQEMKHYYVDMRYMMVKN